MDREIYVYQGKKIGSNHRLEIVRWIEGSRVKEVIKNKTLSNLYGKEIRETDLAYVVDYSTLETMFTRRVYTG